MLWTGQWLRLEKIKLNVFHYRSWNDFEAVDVKIRENYQSLQEIYKLRATIRPQEYHYFYNYYSLPIGTVIMRNIKHEISLLKHKNG